LQVRFGLEADLNASSLHVAENANSGLMHGNKN
jgi:hypothetical protein